MKKIIKFLVLVLVLGVSVSPVLGQEGYPAPEPTNTPAPTATTVPTATPILVIQLPTPTSQATQAPDPTSVEIGSMNTVPTGTYIGFIAITLVILSIAGLWFYLRP